MSVSKSERERWRATEQNGLNLRPLRGLDRIWAAFVGRLKSIGVSQKEYLVRAEFVEKEQSRAECFRDEELKGELKLTSELFRLGRQSKNDEIRALGLIGEACRRTKGIIPYKVQYAGVLAMQSSAIIEMATGEGKSLVAAMAGVLAGWYGMGCHIITVNDYLAQRDALEMKSLYEFCNCSVAFLGGEIEGNERFNAYQADVTYSTEREIVADYLRDALKVSAKKTLAQKMLLATDNNSNSEIGMTQRGLFRAIIDEADSVLIDRAVTPLIISQEIEGIITAESYRDCCKLIGDMKEGVEYKLDNQYKSVVLLPKGNDYIYSNSPAGLKGRMLEDVVVQSLQVRHFYKCNHDYVVDDGKVVLVDNSTGRLMPDHSWRGGIHQAVEAKEGVELTSPKETTARISFQRFFRMYPQLSGMTGTAGEAKGELWQVYNTQVIPIPPRKPCLRVFRNFRVLASKDDKWQEVLLDTLKEHNKGRPVLVGTRHVKDSMQLGDIFKNAAIECSVLNAVNHHEEADIITLAGRRGAVTIATNMAGRGTDIKLEKGVEEIGGLHVIATEIHSSARVDRQLYGRCSRQGDRGSVSVIVSWEDDLTTIFTPLLSRVIRLILGIRLSGEEKGFMLRSIFSVVIFPLKVVLKLKFIKRVFDLVVSRFCFKIAQNKTEKFYKRQRQNAVEQDYAMSDSLAFSGEDLV